MTKIRFQLRNVVKIVAILAVTTMFAACDKTAEATVTRVYQPLASGMVHTWLEVKFDDNSTANVMLPDNNQIWDKARTMKGEKVKLRKQKGEWKFVSF